MQKVFPDIVTQAVDGCAGRLCSYSSDVIAIDGIRFLVSLISVHLAALPATRLETLEALSI